MRRDDFRIFFVSNQIGSPPVDGGELINFRNRSILRTLANKGCWDEVQIRSRGIGFVRKCLSAISGYIAGLDEENVSLIISKIENSRPSVIFIGTSLFGLLCKKIRIASPEIKIVTFFHNCEVKYFFDYAIKGNISAALQLPLVWLNEFMACKKSDQIICLNSRDASIINTLYSPKRVHLLPSSVEDKLTDSRLVTLRYANDSAPDFRLLLVGSAFFPNTHGARWFVKHVLPFVPGHLIIVGTGMESALSDLRSERCSVYGWVDDLSSLYASSHLVVAPIFMGSGMKTKTAEALMFGKTIVGTSEAFEGFDVDVSLVGALCNTDRQFVDAINRYYLAGQTPRFNEYSRKAYRALYSTQAAEEKMEVIFSGLES